MVVTSSTDICNMALDLLQGGFVSNITLPTTSTEEKCARWYDVNRRMLLRMHPWNFAIKRAELSASSTVPLFGATAAFPVTADFLRLLRVVNDEDMIYAASDYFFENKSIMLRYSDATVCKIIYIADVEDVLSFDDIFIQLLAVEIALSLAYSITQNNSNIERLVAIRKTLIKNATGVDGQEHPPEVRRASVNRSARRSLGVRDTSRHYFNG